MTSSVCASDFHETNALALNVRREVGRGMKYWRIGTVSDESGNHLLPVIFYNRSRYCIVFLVFLLLL